MALSKGTASNRPIVSERGKTALLGALGLFAFIALWKSAEAFEWVRRGTMPDPVLVPAAFIDELSTGRFVPAVQSSLIHYFWGLGLGSVFGFAVGFGAASSKVFDGLHGWLARILRPIPPLAWVVFAIAWFKVSHTGAAFVISIGVFWVNYFATYSAVKNIDPALPRTGARLWSGCLLETSPLGHIARRVTWDFIGFAYGGGPGVDDIDRGRIVGCTRHGPRNERSSRRRRI